jgi:glycosyltransferase involved in cell wall biosynthesis
MNEGGSVSASIAPAGSRPFGVLLVGNYGPDAQRSMLRFATLLRDGLTTRGVTVTLLQPPPVLGAVINWRGTGKWLGYIDKFVVFPPTLQRAMRRLGHRTLVVHICDHSNAWYVPSIRHLPHVVTCHDLLAVRSALGEFAEVSTRWSGRILQRRIAKGLRGADRIVCDSNATAADVRRVLHLPETRVTTIPPGVSSAFRPVDEEEATTRVDALLGRRGSARYILHVGADHWYKNRAGLVATYAALVRRVPDAPPLVIAGARLSSQLSRAIADLRLAGRVISVSGPGDRDLAALYSRAALLLFPSLAEGFGWPVLEAMACGCRVVTSNRAPLTEIGGDAATYVDPTDPASTAETVARVLMEAAANRQARQNAGLAQARAFSLEAMTDSYIRIYLDVLAMSGAGATGNGS